MSEKFIFIFILTNKIERNNARKFFLGDNGKIHLTNVKGPYLDYRRE